MELLFCVPAILSHTHTYHLILLLPSVVHTQKSERGKSFFFNLCVANGERNCKCEKKVLLVRDFDFKKCEKVCV